MSSEIPKDELKEAITAIEYWCTENNFSIFYGRLEDEENFKGKVLWDIDNDNWEKFLSIMKNTNSKILIIDISVCNINKEEENYLTDYISDFKHLASQRGTEEAMDFSRELNENYKIVINAKGKIASFSLHFFYNGICYQLYRYAKCHKAYTHLLEIIYEEEEEEESKNAKYQIDKNNIKCPYCDSENFIKFGTVQPDSSKQRFRCKSCKKTFSA